jgi:hypothetical protein
MLISLVNPLLILVIYLGNLDLLILTTIGLVLLTAITKVGFGPWSVAKTSLNILIAIISIAIVYGLVWAAPNLIQPISTGQFNQFNNDWITYWSSLTGMLVGAALVVVLLAGLITLVVQKQIFKLIITLLASASTFCFLAFEWTRTPAGLSLIAVLTSAMLVFAAIELHHVGVTKLNKLLNQKQIGLLFSSMLVILSLLWLLPALGGNLVARFNLFPQNSEINAVIGFVHSRKNQNFFYLNPQSLESNAYPVKSNLYLLSQLTNQEILFEGNTDFTHTNLAYFNQLAFYKQLQSYNVSYLLIDRTLFEGDTNPLLVSDDLTARLIESKLFTIADAATGLDSITILELKQEAQPSPKPTLITYESENLYYSDILSRSVDKDMVLDFVEVTIKNFGTELEVKLQLPSQLLPQTNGSMVLRTQPLTNQVILVIGNTFHGPYSLSGEISQNIVLRQFKLSELENIRIYQLRDTSPIGQAWQWSNPVACEDESALASGVKPSKNSFSANQTFCLISDFPVIESSSSSLLLTNYIFESNAKVSHCYYNLNVNNDCLKGRVIQSGGINSTSQEVLEYLEVGDLKRPKIKLIVSRNSADKDVELIINSGTIKEFELKDILTPQINLVSVLETYNKLVLTKLNTLVVNPQATSVFDLDYTGFALVTSSTGQASGCLYSQVTKLCSFFKAVPGKPTITFLTAGQTKLFLQNSTGAIEITPVNLSYLLPARFR